MVPKPPISLVLRASILASILVLIIAFASDVIREAKIPELPSGCDQFGYLRQARLFQEHGWRGLDTRLQNSQTAYLIEQVFAQGAPPSLWGHGVAPHCHHYNERTRHVILQFPPGAGWLFSFFAEGVQVRWTFAFCCALVLTLQVLLTAASRKPYVPLFAVFVGLIAFRALLLFSEEYSVVPSLAAAALLGWLTVMAATTEGRWRIANFAVLGLAFGLATALRLPNLFSAAGAGLVLALSLRDRKNRPAALAAIGAFGACVLIGLVPVLTANAINAGHPLSTTYGAGDTSPPLLTWDAVREGVRYYLYAPATPASFVWAGAAGLVALTAAARRTSAPGVTSAGTMAAVALALDLIYFVTHRPLIHYYMAFAAIYAVSVAGFGFAKLAALAEPPASGLSRTERTALAVMTALFVVLLVTRVDRPAADPERSRVSAAIEPAAIVWSDGHSGAFNYTLHRQAAVLPFVNSVPLQDALIRKIAADGIPQYLVADSADMATIAARALNFARIVPVGDAFGDPVYRIDVQRPGTAPAGRS